MPLLDIGTRRWAGVPFYLRTGKRSGAGSPRSPWCSSGRRSSCSPRARPSELGQNALVIRVQPDEGVTIRFGSKVPGAGMQVRDVTMDFGYGHAFTEASPEAYERLILDVLLGEPPLFPRHEEVELSWKILDPIEDYWATQGTARAVPARHLGAALGRRACWTATAEAGGARDRRPARPRRRRCRSPLVEIREEGGAVALGRVLTLVIVADARREEEAIEAANGASREHPMRVIVVSSDADERATREARLDAPDPGRRRRRRQRGHRAAAYGPLAARRGEPRMGLLLPDAPVVTWWPQPPARGRARTRSVRWRTAGSRSLGAAGPAGPVAARSPRSYTPGDADFAWTRLTLWRAQLAAVLDQPPYEAIGGRAGDRRHRLAVDRRCSPPG